MESDRRKKFWNDDSCDDAVAVEDLWCARYDSRPELKAKDPKGSAESERRRSAWRAASLEGIGGAFPDELLFNRAFAS